MTLAFGGQLASTIEDHIKFLVRFVIEKRPDIMEYIPFQHKVDIWDLEYAVNRIAEIQDLQRKAMIHCPTCVYIDYIDYSGDTPVPRSEMVTAYTGSYRRGRTQLSYKPLSGEDSTDEDEGASDVNLYLYYVKEVEVTRKYRYRLGFHIPEGSNLSTEVFKERIDELMNDGDYTLREIGCSDDEHDCEYRYDYMDYNSDDGLEAELSDRYCEQVVKEIQGY